MRPARVSQVAFHPGAPVLALGYEDGFVLLCRLSDATEIRVRQEAPEGGAISGNCVNEVRRRWSRDMRLACINVML